MNDLATHGVPARIIGDPDSGHCMLRAHVPAAPSVNIDLDCRRATDGVSWAYISNWGTVLPGEGEAVNHIAWLMGARW